MCALYTFTSLMLFINRTVHYRSNSILFGASACKILAVQYRKEIDTNTSRVVLFSSASIIALRLSILIYHLGDDRDIVSPHWHKQGLCLMNE
jgi:hypothetical protein